MDAQQKCEGLPFLLKFPRVFRIFEKKGSIAHAMPGAVAQLGERLVRNEEVVGSNPISSTRGQVLRNRK